MSAFTAKATSALKKAVGALSSGSGGSEKQGSPTAGDDKKVTAKWGDLKKKTGGASAVLGNVFSVFFCSI